MLFQEPFQHEIGVGAFPDSMYSEMLKNLPDFSEYRSYDEGKSYQERYLYKADKGFWREVFDYLIGPYKGWKTQCQLIRDKPGYSIGPHTDTPKKLKTFLYYLTDKPLEGVETSIFVPKAKGFQTGGGLHYDFDAFEEVKKIPFVPNGYFSFERTNNSFHGVYPTKEIRNVIQLAVYRRDEY